MERRYKDLCQSYKCSAKVFTKPSGGLKNKLGSPDLMIFFTSTMSHKLVQSALSELKGTPTRIERCHTSSLSALRSILKTRRLRRNPYVRRNGRAPVRPYPGRYQGRQSLSLSLHGPGCTAGRGAAAEPPPLAQGLCLLPCALPRAAPCCTSTAPPLSAAISATIWPRRLLAEAGYDGGSCGRCVATLIRRFRQGADFPHEIGLFLSYPPEDVRGFVENHACNYKCGGCGRCTATRPGRRLFTRFKRCTDTYRKLWQAGATIDQLAVAG